MRLYYKGNPATLIGHETGVRFPEYGHYMDYERELGLIIGKAGRNLDPYQAAKCLFGVTIFNYFSARDYQGREILARQLRPGDGIELEVSGIGVLRDRIGDPEGVP